MLDRRSVLVLGTAALADGAASATLGQPNGHAVNGMLYLLGPQSVGRGSAASTLTTINLARERIVQTEIAMRGGHSAVPLGPDRILCVAHHAPRSLVVDGAHRVVAVLEASVGHVFGGHCAVRPAGGEVFLLPMRRARQRSAEDVGRLQVYDATTLMLLNEITSGGLHPHELCSVPGVDELCLTHYGDIELPSRPFRHNAVAPRLTILDSRTLSLKRHYPQPSNAMLTHMRVGSDRHAYCVLTQFVRLDDFPGPLRDQVAAVKALLERQAGRPVAFPTPFQTRAERELAVPLPFLRIDTQTGVTEAVSAGDASHLRSQSVGYNAATETAAAAYFHSETIVLHRRGSSPVVVDAMSLGVSETRGVCDITGTPLMAVSGAEGVALFDVTSLRPVMRFRVVTHAAPHVEYSAI